MSDITRDSDTTLTFTTTGVADVCSEPDLYMDSGWETNELYFRVNYQTHERIWVAACGQNPRYRPVWVMIACADGTSM